MADMADDNTKIQESDMPNNVGEVIDEIPHQDEEPGEDVPRKMVDGRYVALTQEEIDEIAAQQEVDQQTIAEQAIMMCNRPQFYIQLEVEGLSAKLDAYLEKQTKLVQIAFRESITFRKSNDLVVDFFKSPTVKYDQKKINTFFYNAIKL